MANIRVKDLENLQDNGSFIRDLSEAELDLQGGGFFKFLRKVVRAVTDVFGVVTLIKGKKTPP
jgi:hypothetical protein